MNDPAHVPTTDPTEAGIRVIRRILPDGRYLLLYSEPEAGVGAGDDTESDAAGDRPPSHGARAATSGS